MQVWEAINILESLDPKSEVTLVLSKATKVKESKDPKHLIFDNSPIYDKTHVIGKDQWPRTPTGYDWAGSGCSLTKH